jgi:hypothetical protein
MEETSNFKDELAQIDERIVELNKKIELHKALERLHENEDFKLVVMDGYFTKESERIFEMLTIPSNLKRDQLENLMEMMSSIRYFKGYFKTLILEAAMAPEEIKGEQEYRKEVTAHAASKDEE